MISGQANFLQSLGWAVLNSLWQMALLWVIYQVITGLTNSSRSSFRSSLASLLLITGFALFIYTFISFYSNHSSDQAILAASFLNTEENYQLSNWLQRILPVASVFYLVMLIIPVSHFIRNYRYVQVIRQYGLTKVDVQWRMFVKKVGDRMGIKKPVHIWVSEFVSSPVTIGFLKPVILVPLAAINHLSPQQMEAVLLHELSHIRRYDYLVNLIINFIQTVLYFNPFVKAFVKIVEKEREKSCDEMVLQFQYDSYEYATALLTLEKTNHEYKPLTLGATGKKNDLLQRVELIMGVKTKPVLSFNKFAGLLCGLICIIALNTLLIISKPPGRKSSGSFASLSSPFNFFTNSISESSDAPVAEEQKPAIITNSSRQAVAQPVTAAWHGNNMLPLPSSNPGVINVRYEPVETMPLKKYEEAQVKAAMDASKKVLENEEWKALEKNVADVFTQKEKEELKETYKKEMDKMDWNKWENQLRLAYDKVDWNRVNEQLTKAVNNIRIDSLQKVYTDVICKLDLTQQQLSQNNLPGIPDSDITLKTIEERRQLVQRTLNRLKAVRNKKIVHL
ncbi:MAG TPA: M56 family metallopeptidase [Chitinophagaceae bacterium]|nr:M56 family metallopeptidase [Chitinophagaceae bacterium]